MRVIPARAGNGGHRPTVGPRRTGHPRAGGERAWTWDADPEQDGSSPRGRGTVDGSRPARGDARVIPARAGNGPGKHPRPAGLTGHPRAGGERVKKGDPRSRSPGSSPRGRGTAIPGATAPGRDRVIPARAGNGSPALPSGRCSAGHPRAGGERRAAASFMPASAGSSPRGRGTDLARELALGVLRVIPARAGNGTRPRCSSRRGSGHPRAGGERPNEGTKHRQTAGSSPRGRGTEAIFLSINPLERVIPARAGNGPPRHKARGRSSGHPRAGGERLGMPEDQQDGIGSSPRGRGTDGGETADRYTVRVIPARAGNGGRWARRPADRAGHPRAGGERPAARGGGPRQDGSSPRGRGTAGAEVPEAERPRVIPARAGNGLAVSR